MDYFFSFDKLDYVSGKKRSKDECIFCSLLKQETDELTLRLLTTDHCIVLLNLYPYNPGHCMIIPVRHVTDIRNLSAEENQEITIVKNYILDMLDNVYSPHGYNIGYNMGLPAGASIQHLHLHLIPRYPNEIGLAELIGGKRVLVENPVNSATKLKKWVENHPFSM